MWGSSWGAGTRGQLESVCAQTRLRAGAGGEGQQGDVKELLQIHRDLLLWLQQLQSFVAPDCWGGGNGTPRTAQGGQELGLVWVSAALEQRCLFCFPRLGLGQLWQLSRGRKALVSACCRFLGLELLNQEAAGGGDCSAHSGAVQGARGVSV